MFVYHEYFVEIWRKTGDLGRQRYSPLCGCDFNGDTEIVKYRYENF
jgi:hypothetical protein